MLQSIVKKPEEPKPSSEIVQIPKKKKNRIGKTPAEKINWSPEEDEELKRLVQIYGENSWHRL